MTRILVVDDEQIVASVVQKILERGGHEVVAVLSIPEALAAVQGSASAPFHLLVTDHSIGISGTCFELLSSGLTECQELFPRRVLVMSGRTPENLDVSMAEACRSGFIPFYMNKPVQMEVILSFVSCLLSLQRADAAP